MHIDVKAQAEAKKKLYGVDNPEEPRLRTVSESQLRDMILTGAYRNVSIVGSNPAKTEEAAARVRSWRGGLSVRVGGVNSLRDLVISTDQERAQLLPTRDNIVVWEP